MTTVYLREVDAGTDNACLVVCAKGDPGSVAFVPSDPLFMAINEACDLLAERKYGSPARSAGHNARLILEAALSRQGGPVLDIANEAFENGQRLERDRCIKLICPHCASGNAVDRDGEHVLETIEGHVSWSQYCQANALRQSK